jgi:nucleotide-binding universal stress UspA family protein
VLPGAPDVSALFPEGNLARVLSDPVDEQAVRRALVEHVRTNVGLELNEIFVERGSAHVEIVRRAETWGASYIVLGSHGRTGLARVVLGSVAESVVRHAHCSVLVARPVRQPGVVLAATDLSDASLPAVVEGAAAAKRSGARLVVVSAIEWADPVSLSVGNLLGVVQAVPTVELQHEVRDALRTTLEESLVRLGVQGEARVLEGSPAAEIVRAAEELGAELVVMGTRGRTGLARVVLGSVAERVVRNATTSVLAVRLHPAE